MKKATVFICFIVTLIVLPAGMNAETRRSKKPKSTSTVPAATGTPQPTSTSPAGVPAKRNERPADGTTAEATPIGPKGTKAAQSKPVYFYEFTRPGFTYPRIMIEHDEAGAGKISFQKGTFDEMITDPIALSAVTLAKINDALTAMNFLDSTESYQHARDYSHMGNVSFTVRKSGRERTVKYNWTENKNAKLLMDEYRRIGNEYTWRFEIMTARANYPLQTPGLMDTVDSYIKRDEISDPAQLLPFLRELSTDERLPLMARNRAVKLVKELEKPKK